ncbi:hypothetical protein FDUTEX481_03292 [Tolypothrix sp. PCC 7601]|nr:hypothetical protein FDUTEX481_03292 [Tolypothrix sp. PCC 7601]
MRFDCHQLYPKADTVIFKQLTILPIKQQRLLTSVRYRSENLNF